MIRSAERLLRRLGQGLARRADAAAECGGGGGVGGGLRLLPAVPHLPRRQAVPAVAAAPLPGAGRAGQERGRGPLHPPVQTAAAAAAAHAQGDATAAQDQPRQRLRQVLPTVGGREPGLVSHSTTSDQTLGFVDFDFQSSYKLSRC